MITIIVTTHHKCLVFQAFTHAHEIVSCCHAIYDYLEKIHNLHFDEFQYSLSCFVQNEY